MAQDWKVTKAFQGKNKETNEPEVVNTQGGAMHKFLVQVENQPIPGWINMLKKQGNEVKEGDMLYGDIVKNQWGKPQFNKSQRPDGNFGGGNSGTPVQSGSIVTNDRVEYAITLLEALYTEIFGQQPPAQAKTAEPKAAPVQEDLSEPLKPEDLPY